MYQGRENDICPSMKYNCVCVCSAFMYTFHITHIKEKIKCYSQLTCFTMVGSWVVYFFIKKSKFLRQWLFHTRHMYTFLASSVIHQNSVWIYCIIIFFLWRKNRHFQLWMMNAIQTTRFTGLSDIYDEAVLDK